MEAQLQIRQEAQEKQDVLNDLLRWNPDIQKRTGANSASRVRSAGPAVPGTQDGIAPVRSRAGPSQGKQPGHNFPSNTLRETVTRPLLSNPGTAANHTYDKSTKKWDKFDYDAAMAEADDENGNKKQSFSFPKSSKAAPTESRQACLAGASHAQAQQPSQHAVNVLKCAACRFAEQHACVSQHTWVKI